MGKVTIEQVTQWVGDMDRREILEILAELANGEYDTNTLKSDIIMTCE